MTGYFPDSESGIVVNNGGAMTTAPLLVLRKNVPCVDYNPAGVSITLPWGGTGNQTLNLTNIGSGFVSVHHHRTGRRLHANGAAGR